MDSTLPVGGVLVDRYRIVGQLGRGGMGITYAAEALDGGALVAIKQVVLRQAEAWKTVELFHREARVLYSLRHPNIPRYIEFFQQDDDQGPAFYLVQERAPGQTLAALVESGARFDIQEVKRITVELLRTLSYLQSLSPPIVHRDIKPQNVIRADDGRIALVDFGAVRDTYRNTLSQGGTMVGTYGYMAPEQFRGAAAPSTDLYGLGATIVFLLTGRHPADLPHDRLRLDFRHAAQVPDAFSAWLDRMVAPAQEDRFSSSAEALRALMQPTAPKASAPTTGRWRVAALLATLGITLLAGAGVWLWNFDTSRTFDRAPSAAVQPNAAVAVEPYKVLSAHWSAVFDVAFTPDGKGLYSGSFDKTIKRWNVENAAVQRSFAGHAGPVGGLALTPAGDRLVSTGDSTVRVWSTEDGRLIHTLSGHSGRTTRVDLTSDGKTAVSGGFDGTVRIWDVDSGKPGRVLTHGPRVLAVKVTPDDKTIVSAGDSKVVKLWDLESGRLVRELSGHTAPVAAIAMAGDGQTVATSGDDGTIRVWALSEGRPMHVLESHRGEVWGLAFAPDGKMLASVGDDDVVRLWDAYAGKMVRSFPAGQKGPLCAAFSADGAWLATGGASNTVRIWRVLSMDRWIPPLADEVPPRVLPNVSEDSKDVAALTSRATALIDAYGGVGANLDEAQRLLERARSVKSDEPEIDVQLARCAYKRGYIKKSEHDPKSLEAAHALLDRALSVDPKCYSAHVQKFFVHLSSKDLGKAKASYERARELRPDDPHTLLLEGKLAKEEDDMETVRRVGRQLVETSKNPDFRYSGYGLLQTALFKDKDWEGVDICYRSMIRLDPESAWSKGNYAAFLVRRKDPEGAIKWARAAIDQLDYGMAHVTLSDAYHLQASRAHRTRNEDPEAGRLFRLSIKEDPRNARAHLGLGYHLRAVAVAEQDASLLAEARRAFEQASKLDPKLVGPEKALAEHAEYERKLSAGNTTAEAAVR